MKTFLLLLILSSFIQSAFLPFNLVLVLLVARSLAVEDRNNLVLAFAGGLALSFLTQTNLGYWPLVLVLTVKLTGMIKKLPLSFNPLIIFLSGIVIVWAVALTGSVFINEKIQISNHLIESVLIVPVFYLVRAWEERFVVKGTIRLKM
ncbi:MAG TPA: hypothetical protein VJG66_02145 [Patescibacteria group bacterium]|nr:hypothetical protein [Patescibacteria group bacterium]